MLNIILCTIYLAIQQKKYFDLAYVLIHGKMCNHLFFPFLLNLKLWLTVDS